MAPADFDPAAVQQGYAQRWAAVAPDAEVRLSTPDEAVASLLSGAQSKGLRRHATSKRSQVTAGSYGPALGGATLAPAVPDQRAMGDDAKRAWLDGLASGRPLGELATAPPHGLRRRALFDALWANRVSLGRASWLVRVTCLNQPAARALAPTAGGSDAAAAAASASERSRLWTSDLCDCLLQLLPDTQAPLPQSFHSADAASGNMSRWQHAARLTAWTAGEGLLHAPDLLEWATNSLRQSPDAAQALAPFARAIAAGTVLSPQGFVRLLNVLRRCVTGCADAHSLGAQQLLEDVLLSAPHAVLCVSLQDATSLVPPHRGTLDLGAAPACVRAQEALRFVSHAAARVGAVVTADQPGLAAAAAYAALDSALVTGDVDAACNSLFGDCAAISVERVALLCDWMISEPWGAAGGLHGPSPAPARKLLGIRVLKAAGERAPQLSALRTSLPILHDHVVAWAEGKLHIQSDDALRASSLVAAAGAAGIISSQAYVARSVALGRLNGLGSSAREASRMLLEALPAPGGEASAEVLQFLAERAALLAETHAAPPVKRARVVPDKQQPTDVNVVELQEAMSMLLGLPAAKLSTGSGAGQGTLDELVQRLAGLSPHMLSRLSIWLDTSVRRAALTPHSEGRHYLTATRASYVAVIMAALDAHAKIPELVVSLMLADVMSAASAALALQRVAVLLPVSGVLPRLLDAVARCAEEECRLSATGSSRPAAPAATSMLLWLLERFYDAHDARSWRVTATLRFPSLAHAVGIAEMLSSQVPSAPRVTAMQFLPVDEPSEAVRAVLAWLHVPGTPNVLTVTAGLAAALTSAQSLLDASYHLSRAALRALCDDRESKLVYTAISVLVSGSEHLGAVTEQAAPTDTIGRGVLHAIDTMLHDVPATGKAGGDVLWACTVLLAECIAEGLSTFEESITTLLPLPVPSGTSASAAWTSGARMLLAESHQCMLSMAQANVDARVLLPILEVCAQVHVDNPAAAQALHAVSRNVTLRRALLSNMHWGCEHMHGRGIASVLQMLRSGCMPVTACDTVVADTASAIVMMPCLEGVGLTVVEVRLRLGDSTTSSKFGAHAALAALGAQPDVAPVIAACVSLLDAAVSAEILLHCRTLLASQDLLTGCSSLRSSLLALAGEGVALPTVSPHKPCALEGGLALLLHSCLVHEHTTADARHTFAAAIVQQLKTQSELLNQACDAAAAQMAVWLRLRLLLPLLPIVVAEVQKVQVAELRGAHAASARAAAADAGEELAQRLIHLLHVVVVGVWPAWLPEAMRPATPPVALSADSLLRLQPFLDSAQLSPAVHANLSSMLSSAARTHAASVELPAAEPVPHASSKAKAALHADPWLLLEDGCCHALAGAVRVQRPA